VASIRCRSSSLSFSARAAYSPMASRTTWLCGFLSLAAVLRSCSTVASSSRERHLDHACLTTIRPACWPISPTSTHLPPTVPRAPAPGAAARFSAWRFLSPGCRP
jgi:hypothetical protein